MNGIAGNLILLDQLLDLLNQMNDSMIQSKLPAFGGATIGQHFRHIFDFYECILNSDSVEILDYACRSRDSEIERNVLKLASSFGQLKDDFSKMNPDDSLFVLSDFANDKDIIRQPVKSSIGRELMYAFDHAVHHLAIIKIGLRIHFPEIHMGANLGKAPSTVKFQEANHTKG